MKFMASSLEKGVNNLPKVKFKHLSKYFQGEKLNLLLRKGIFPYEYLDDIS